MRRSVVTIPLVLAAAVATSCSDSTAPNQRPVATISAPSTGTEAFAGDPVTFQGSATDAESGSLTGSALLWQSDLDGVLGSGERLTRSDLSTGTHRITLSATDPAGGSGTASISISIVENQPPTATIATPADGAQFLALEQVDFAGSATDFEDGTVTGSELAWTSDVDGDLGTGTETSASDLSVGLHQITLTARDSRGLVGTAFVGIEILANEVPSVTISQPPDAAEFSESETIMFEGAATDSEDGTLTGSSLVWNSSLDGEIGTGISFSSSSLTVGDHAITLTATDAQGQEGSATVSIRVTSPTGISPVASFTSSCNGLTCDFTDASTDADGTVVSWSWDFGAEQTSSEQNPQHLFATGGPHTVTLVVQDDAGNDSDPSVEDLNLTTPVQAGFQIEIRESPGSVVNSTQRAAIDAAVARWQEVITVDLPEEQLVLPANACGVPQPALDEVMDDLVIYLSFTEIDGPGQILGSAGPCWIRDGSFLPALGIMRFDVDDLDRLATLGWLKDVLLHEMGHVLGFGTLWSRNLGGGLVIFDFLNDPTEPASPTAPDSVPSNDTYFDGPFAVAAFDDISDPDYTAGAKVPVENDNQTPDPVWGSGSLNGHWREGVFGSELMTPGIGSASNPMSLVTVESLRDMGYGVDAASADPFPLTFNLLSDIPGPPIVDLNDDLWRGPMFIGDRLGSMRSIVR
jgi:PKD repeat protein